MPTDFLECRKKILRDGRLYDVSQSACAEGLHGHLRSFVLTQNDYLGLRKHAADFSRGFKTIQIWHAEIHENKIGEQHFSLLYGIATVHGLATHVEISLRQQERPHPSSYDFMVIYYKYSQSEPRSGMESQEYPSTTWLNGVPLGHVRQHTQFDAKNAPKKEG